MTAPTLDEGGYTTHTCSRCGGSYVDSETPALGHKCAAYTDIPTDWAKEGICFVIENGLMVGDLYDVCTEGHPDARHARHRALPHGGQPGCRRSVRLHGCG